MGDRRRWGDVHIAFGGGRASDFPDCAARNPENAAVFWIARRAMDCYCLPVLSLDSASRNGLAAGAPAGLGCASRSGGVAAGGCSLPDCASRNGVAAGAPARLLVAQGTHCRCSRSIARRAMDSLSELRPVCTSHSEKGLAFVDFAHGVPRGARSFAYPCALCRRTLAVLRKNAGGGEAGASRAR